MWNTLKRWYHQLGSPRYFYRFADVVLPWLWPLALIILAIGLVWGLAYAPVERYQGDSYRIIYLHVPASSGALMGYIAMGVAGLVCLVWRMKMAEVMLKALAPFGAVLAAVSLISGAIWGKPTWGTYWQWDARLTSMLILLFMYLGVMVLQSAIRDPRQAARAASLLALVGVINVVIVKYSVEWLNTLHQGATLNLFSESSINPAMKYPLLISMLGMWLLYAANVLMRARAEVLSRERRSGWVRKLVEGH
ncbi:MULTISPECIES: heme ABC transporter permease CcmC [Alloalcanivorax]|uniref:Heme exporter protein C n=2 Tax=Alloalcanivorax TaxID=3020832 RepID=K0CB64_ALCDB|nr:MULTISPECIES: heme ABC transporter permease CcmC [Alloalcanivorax]KYZ87086.1 heme ABC transporter permease [Alcanivorax sp. KX64203]AFT69853.1 Heme exporter protein C [Alloalcanivorax dieselolei B5]MCE7524790.1 heme ABC transporter permease CcmC [Alloalcanivorax xenomutans]MCU5784073.1 Heme exporter protein C [Alloalcanivorax balearicus MACL04]WOA32934.1 heme ABC transporter permease CcmC [Alloalcanivorax xenomutans]